MAFAGHKQRHADLALGGWVDQSTIRPFFIFHLDLEFAPRRRMVRYWVKVFIT
jgi:hypothetical protein